MCNKDELTLDVGIDSICKDSRVASARKPWKLILCRRQLETYYHLTYTVVSLVFLSPVIGYASAALLNNRIHMTLGQRGIAVLGPGCHVIAYVINCLHPPYPVLVISMVFGGFGNGLLDSAWNAWIGNMANANEVLGILHGLYGAGAVFGPFIATSLITKAKLPWWYFYYIMVCFFLVTPSSH